MWHPIIAFGLAHTVVACHHRPWMANTVERCQAWHAIIAFGQHTRSNDVACGITSPPFDSTHGQTTSGVACHNLLWVAHTVERRRAWHAITDLGRQTQSNDITRGITSPRLDSSHGRTKSGMTCHHRLWKTHTVEQCQAWHAIIAFGLHKDRTTSGVSCHHRLWAAQTVE